MSSCSRRPPVLLEGFHGGRASRRTVSSRPRSLSARVASASQRAHASSAAPKWARPTSARPSNRRAAAPPARSGAPGSGGGSPRRSGPPRAAPARARGAPRLVRNASTASSAVKRARATSPSTAPPRAATSDRQVLHRRLGVLAGARRLVQHDDAGRGQPEQRARDVELRAAERLGERAEVASPRRSPASTSHSNGSRSSVSLPSSSGGRQPRHHAEVRHLGLDARPLVDPPRRLHQQRLGRDAHRRLDRARRQRAPSSNGSSPPTSSSARR